MKPKFVNEQAWEQAEILMQPAYIRLVDQIRQQTEENEQDIQVSYEEITTPYPSNLMCLQPKGSKAPTGKSLRVNIWDLCFQVCFISYEPLPAQQVEQLVAIDISLFNPDSQEIDWTKLDLKAQAAVHQVFARFKLLSSTTP
jgi:hypothetical protein